MSPWLITAIALGLLVLVSIPLTYLAHKGCGLALLGAILVGGATLAAGLYYLGHGYVPPPPRSPYDSPRLEGVFKYLIVLPVVGAIVGLFLGISCASWLKRRTRDESSSRSPEPPRT